MKTRLFYRHNSEHERKVLEYLRDFKMQTGKELLTVDVDSREGIELCQLYDIMKYPAIVVTDDYGKIINIWSGDLLPRIGEVGYYVQ